MKENIYNYIKNNRQATPNEIERSFSLSRTMVHRHLLGLLKEGKILKMGKSPKVFYIINPNFSNLEIQNFGTQKEEERVRLVNNFLGGIIEDNFSFIKPNGTELLGVAGFLYWCDSRKLEIEKTAKQYCEIIKEYNLLVKNNFIDATIKIKNSFKENQNLDSLHYLLFYSLPIFGRTKISSWLFYGKTLQQKELIKKVLDFSIPLINKFIKENKIDAICFVPPSVPRQIQFMKELEKALQSNLPKIEIIKIQTPITVQQKSLKSIEDRIENAQSTMFIENNIRCSVVYKKLVIIDDFTGSGATLNVLAGKIKEQNIAKEVLGLTITGSVNGFEVVKEV